MAYTTINKHTDNFNTKLYTGNGSTQSITGVGFQPDLTWIKSRGDGNDHQLVDAVRGATYSISSNRNDSLTWTDGLTSFDSDGYSLGANSRYNGNSINFVGWNWKSNGAGSANTNGTISSTVSANTTAGFSIVKYTGNATSGATVGHGLGSTPKMIITKNISTTSNWHVYHEAMGATKYLHLNSSNAQGTASSVWNDTAPTSSVFSIGSGDGTNKSGDTIVAYCFAEKKGYSKFGSYTGNGNADGPFIYTGFKPAFVLLKNTAGSYNWNMQDNKRIGFNPVYHHIAPNNSNAEVTSVSSYSIDLLSNGFKIRNNLAVWNGNPHSHIYMAFGQSLVGSNNVPCTAR